MSTDFVQHNPSATNQQDNASFDSDSLTTGGLGVDNIVPSDWLNKRLYQDSTMTSALALMMSNKGYTMNDADKGVLANVLANIITNADLKPSQINVPYSPTPTFNAALSSGFRFELGGPVTSSSLINGTAGQIVTFFIVSQSPGNIDFTWPNNLSGGGNVRTQSVYDQTGTISNLFVQQFITDGGNWFAVDTLTDWAIAQLSAKQNNLGFTPVQQGGGAGQFGNKVFIGWNNSRLKAQVDGLDLGNIVFDSNLPAQVLPGINNNANGAIAIPTSAGLNVLIQWCQGTAINSAVTVTQTVNWPQSFSVIFRAFVSDFFVSGPDNDIMAWQLTGYNVSNCSLRRARRGDDSAYNSAPILFAIGLG